MGRGGRGFWPSSRLVRRLFLFLFLFLFPSSRERSGLSFEAELSSPRHLPRLVPAPGVVSEKFHVAPTAHLHKSLRLPLLSRRGFFLPFGSAGTIAIDGNGFRDPIVDKAVLAFGVLLEDFDRHAVILVFDDFADLDIVDAAEEGAFATDFAFREVELVHGARQPVGAVGEFEFAVRDPGMLEAFVDGDPLVDVDSQHAVDEVEGRVANGVPVWRWIIEAASFDLLGEIVRVFRGVELV